MQRWVMDVASEPGHGRRERAVQPLPRSSRTRAEAQANGCEHQRALARRVLKGPTMKIDRETIGSISKQSRRLTATLNPLQNHAGWNSRDLP